MTTQPPVQDGNVNLSSQVVYHRNRWFLPNAGPAIIRWQNNRVQAYEMDARTGQVAKQLFDCEPTAFEKIHVSINMLVFRCNGKDYWLDFTPPSGVGPVPGIDAVALVADAYAISRSDLPKWVNLLKEHNIPVNERGSVKNTTKYMLLTVAALVGLFILAAAVAIIHDYIVNHSY